MRRFLPAIVTATLLVACGGGSDDAWRRTEPPPASGLAAIATGATGTPAPSDQRPSSPPAGATAGPATPSPRPVPVSSSTAATPSPTAVPASPTAAAARPASPPARSGPIDACALVRSQDVEAALGYSLGAGRLEPNPGRLSSGRCTYLDEPARRGLEVAVIAGESTVEGNARAHWANLRGNYMTRGSQAVQGLGDEAFFVPDLRLLHVLQGDHVVGLQLADPNLNPDATRMRLVGLARVALARL